MTPREKLDHFGKLVVAKLWDNPLVFLERMQKGEMAAPSLRPLQKALAKFEAHEQKVVKVLVQEVLTTAIHDFLFGLVESHDFNGGIEVLSHEVNVVPVSDGIHVEIFGRDGWIAEYGEVKEEYL